MGKVNREPFDTAAFLAAEGPGRSISNYTATQIFFSQGSPADSVFYLETGRADQDRRGSARRSPRSRPPGNAAQRAQHQRHQIGRASCREKSVDLGGRRIIKKTTTK